jgi:hypothetical protein
MKRKNSAGAQYNSEKVPGPLDTRGIIALHPTMLLLLHLLSLGAESIFYHIINPQARI